MVTIVPKENPVRLKILIHFYSYLKSDPKMELITWENFVCQQKLICYRFVGHRYP